MTAPRRVVVLGGTFDPFHLGHLAIAEQARDLCGADEAWLVPARTPPHRPGASASPEDRLEMVRAAVEGRPGLRVLDLELRREGPSYTVDTLTALGREHPGVELWFVLGADAAREIGGWNRRDLLMRIAHFVLVNREGVGAIDEAEAARLGFVPERTRIIRVVSPDVSATEVRRRAAAGEPLDALVPEVVARLIRARGLYGRPEGAV